MRKTSLRGTIGIMALFLSAQIGLAQESATPTAQEPTTEATTSTETAETKCQTTCKTTSTQSGSWCQWSKMTGDWGGVRSDLADAGITLDIDYTQIMQNNMHGGRRTTNALRSSGSGDITLKLDTGKMGLWPGGTFVLNAEPKWGDGINSKVGSLAPVNMDAIKPGAGEGAMFTLSEFFYQQVLFDGKLILLAGKLDGARAFDTNAFANNERTQFMNIAFRNNCIIPTFLPYTTMGLGVIVNPTDWLTISTAVTDSEGRAKTTGFETTFHGPTHTTVIHEWGVKVKPFGLPGNQRVGFTWTSMEKPEHQPLSPFKEAGPLLMKVLGPGIMGKILPLLPFNDNPDATGIYYNFDQYLYTEADDPTQGIGVFGRFGWAKQSVCPVAHTYSVGVSGKGVIPERDNDTFGLGYYFIDLSNDLPSGYHSEQGVECYYNVEITPWLHISPDLQVIVNPGGTDANDVSVVGGVRMQMNL